MYKFKDIKLKLNKSGLGYKTYFLTNKVFISLYFGEKVVLINLIINKKIINIQYGEKSIKILKVKEALANFINNNSYDLIKLIFEK